MIGAPTEGERRIRSLVRAAVSPGVWLVVFLQLLLVVSRWAAPPDQPAQWIGRLALIAGAVTVMFYGVSGAYQALARTRSVLSIRAVIESGRDAFYPLLGLVVKTGLLGLLGAFVVLLAAQSVGFARDEQAAAALIPTVALAIGGILSFIFVYWLPWVFVNRDFRVFPGLRAAVTVLWSRLAQSGFVAVLTLGPTAIALALPDQIGLAIVLLVSMLNQMTAWIAYIYCAEYLNEQTGRA
jgi:hypothetical protein